ncbi:uncharacterized protein SAPINGB_P000802 [Magnusiomyces paraingens]|uniref:Nudix hydrolase domain-containing protein n=1 Tax=Magnusiomyces paraingens TaxID=2606893 RepID=A0A5E8B2D4_9ASCO|nr:uncharacterized protein SAPINGB_P000802 [Saprochaete ingens]VVT45583.1 unnamed protein product [Saprochaete ingens]
MMGSLNESIIGGATKQIVEEGHSVGVVKTPGRSGSSDLFTKEGARVVACLVVSREDKDDDESDESDGSNGNESKQEKSGTKGEKEKEKEQEEEEEELELEEEDNDNDNKDDDNDDDGGHRVLLVSVKKGVNKWTLPKGGVEEREAHDYGLAAIRETWEEAGVLVRKLGKDGREERLDRLDNLDGLEGLEGLKGLKGKVSGNGRTICDVDHVTSSGEYVRRIELEGMPNGEQFARVGVFNKKKLRKFPRGSQGEVISSGENWIYFYEGEYGADVGGEEEEGPEGWRWRWLESGKRDRVWVNVLQAERMLRRSGREEMVRALQMSRVYQRAIDSDRKRDKDDKDDKKKKKKKKRNKKNKNKNKKKNGDLMNEIEVGGSGSGSGSGSGGGSGSNSGSNSGSGSGSGSGGDLTKKGKSNEMAKRGEKGKNGNYPPYKKGKKSSGSGSLQQAKA